jgi:hypothetical protein
MKKYLFFALVIVFFASCGKVTTYRLRTVSGGNVMIVEQAKVNGLRVGDTIQLTRDVSYPYDYQIDENKDTRQDTIYLIDYLTSTGDTASMVISKKVARIEAIE